MNAGCAAFKHLADRKKQVENRLYTERDDRPSYADSQVPSFDTRLDRIRVIDYGLPQPSICLASSSTDLFAILTASSTISLAFVKATSPVSKCNALRTLKAEDLQT